METKEQLYNYVHKNYNVLESKDYGDFMTFVCARRLNKDNVEISNVTTRQDKRTKDGWTWGYTEKVTFPLKYTKFLKYS